MPVGVVVLLGKFTLDKRSVKLYIAEMFMLTTCKGSINEKACSNPSPGPKAAEDSRRGDSSPK